MINAFRAIDPFSRKKNVPRKRFLIGIFLGLKSQDPSLFNALRILRPLTNLEKTIEMIGEIKEAIIIVAFAEPDFKILPQPLK